MASSASWEHWKPSWADVGPDAAHGHWGDDSDCDDPDDLEDITADAAGQELVCILIDLKNSGRLSAVQACTISWFAAKAGAAGPCAAFGLKPQESTGEYSKKFDAYTNGGPESMDFYELSIAYRHKAELGRRWSPLPFLPPHEMLVDEFLSDTSAENAFQQALEEDTLPPIWTRHAAVTHAKAIGENLPRPFCLYVDGVQYSRRETVLGFWVHWLYSKQSHLLFVLRKSESCLCGCKSWCSLFPVWDALRWSLEALLAGVYPSHRHDGSEWLPQSDDARASFAGQRMPVRGLCIFSKGIGQSWCSAGASLGGTRMSHHAFIAIPRRAISIA